MIHVLPADRYILWVQNFVHTIRSEIAACAHYSYPFLPVSSAKNLFFLDSDAAVVEFAYHNGWSVDGDSNIRFPRIVSDGNDDGDDAEGGAGSSGGDVVGGGAGRRQKATIQNMVGYARELEMIV